MMKCHDFSLSSNLVIFVMIILFPQTRVKCHEYAFSSNWAKVLIWSMESADNSRQLVTFTSPIYNHHNVKGLFDSTFEVEIIPLSLNILTTVKKHL